MKKYVYCDFETRSKVDLKKVGVDNYARHPSTRVLMLALAVDDGPAGLWELHKRPAVPLSLRALIDDPNATFVAHNAAFERAIFKHVLDVDIPPHRWICTMAMAYSLALPGALDQLTRDALKLKGDFQKIGDGKRYIQIFCKPRPKNHVSAKNPHEFNDWDTHPEEWNLFGVYCRRDVVAERKVFLLLRKFFPNLDETFDLWAYDQQINDSGFPLDLDLIDGAIALAKEAKTRLKREMIELSGLSNPGSTPQALAWLRERGYPFASIKKDRVKIAIVDFGDHMTEEALQFLTLRANANKTSVKKFDAMLRAVADDGILRNTLQFCGAGRTGRWAGRVAQLQNLPRPMKRIEKHLDYVRQLIRDCDYDTLELLFGNVLDVLVSSIRSAIIAPPGKILNVCDLSAIELCVLAWISGCEFWLDVLKKKLDPYKAFGVHYLGKPYEQISKDERNECKPAALGAGYRLGGGELRGQYPDQIKTGLWGYAASMGVELSQAQSKRAVAVYRDLSPEIKQMWYDLENAARDCIKDQQPRQVGDFTFDIRAPFMRIRLPSGRYLFYCRPQVKLVRTPLYERDEDGNIRYDSYGEPIPELDDNGRPKFMEKGQVSYEGVHQTTKAWVRIETHGGKLIENCLSEETLILTLSGAKPIIDVTREDKLWDGEQWVSHDGLVDQGVQEVFEMTEGVLITPNHKIEIDNSWVAAENISYEQATSSFRRYHRLPFGIFDGRDLRRLGRKKVAVADPVRVRDCGQDGCERVSEGQAKVLRMQDEAIDWGGQFEAPYVEASGLRGASVDARQMQQPKSQGIQELRRTGHKGLSSLAFFRDVLVRYGRKLRRGLRYRTAEQHARVQQSELPLDHKEDQQPQSPQQQDYRYAERQDVALRGVGLERPQRDDALLPAKAGVADESIVRPTRFHKQVYDLLNAGPHHRFTIFDAHGRPALVHNCVQAVARDVLVHGMLEARTAGFNIIGHVHDELISLDDENDERLNVALLRSCMSKVPAWAKGLPLDAAGFQTKFYRKD